MQDLISGDDSLKTRRDEIAKLNQEHHRLLKDQAVLQAKLEITEKNLAARNQELDDTISDLAQVKKGLVRSAKRVDVATSQLVGHTAILAPAGLPGQYALDIA